MSCEVEGRSITVASHFNPAIRCLNFSIPAVVGVVSHLIAAMLSEADGFSFDSALSKEQVASRNEIRHCLIFYHSLLESLLDSVR